MKFFGYGIDDFIPCEVCRSKAVDIHHIDSRGMGGNPSRDKDKIENLQALCRQCHTNYGDDPKCFELLKHLHEKTIKTYTDKLNQLNK